MRVNRSCAGLPLSLQTGCQLLRTYLSCTKAPVKMLHDGDLRHDTHRPGRLRWRPPRPEWNAARRVKMARTGAASTDDEAP